MEAALKKRIIGRLIVGAVAKKHTKLASFLAKLVGLEPFELRNYQEAPTMDTKFELVYLRRVVATMTVYEYERLAERVNGLYSAM